MTATCGHVTCSRRRHLVAVLIKSALDGAYQLKSINTVGVFGQEKADEINQTVERTYHAVEALGPQFTEEQVNQMFGKPNATPRSYPLYDDMLPLEDGRVVRRMEESKP